MNNSLSNPFKLLQEITDAASRFHPDPSRVLFRFEDGMIWAIGIRGDDGEPIYFSQWEPMVGGDDAGPN